MDTNNQLPQMSMAGYLPNGMKVFFTVPIALDQIEYAYEIALKMSNTLLAKGLTLTEPGLEAGEQSYTITHILRRTQPGKDGKPATPIIDFYHDDLKWSDLKTWLNTPEQIAEFEQWSGVSLKSMQAFPGSRLERGNNPEADSYVVQLKPSVRVTWRLNPDYTEGSKTEAKREFVRFESTMPQNAAPHATKNAPPAQQVSSQAKAQETPQNGAMNDNEPIPYVAPGDKQWWPMLYKIITPWYDNPKHAVNSAQRLAKGGPINVHEMTVAQAVEVIRKHLLDKSAYAAATFDELDNK